MSAYYFLDVTILPCGNPSRVIKRIEESLRGIPAEGQDNGELIWLFKVLGESRLLAVTKDTPEPYWEALCYEVGSTVQVKCHPLRPYENFAHSVNKVDEELCEPSPRKLDPGETGRLYFIDAVLSYKGFSLEELLETWPKESKFMLGARKSGEIQVELFKVLAANRVIVFLVKDPDSLDDLFFKVPLVTDLGDNLLLMASEVKAL